MHFIFALYWNDIDLLFTPHGSILLSDKLQMCLIEKKKKKKKMLQNYAFPEQWIYLCHPFQWLSFDKATKIVLLEIYANKKQIKRAFDDTEAYVSVFLHKTCCGYSLELPWRGDSYQLYIIG